MTEEYSPKGKADYIYKNLPVERLELSARARNALKQAGIVTIGQVMSKTIGELLNMRGMGPGSVGNIAATFENLTLTARVEVLEKQLEILRDAVMRNAVIRQAYKEALEVDSAMDSVKERGNGN